MKNLIYLILLMSLSAEAKKDVYVYSAPLQNKIYSLDTDKKELSLLFKNKLAKKITISENESQALQSDIKNLVWDLKYKNPSAKSKGSKVYAEIQSPEDTAIVYTSEKSKAALTFSLNAKLNKLLEK